MHFKFVNLTDARAIRKIFRIITSRAGDWSIYALIKSLIYLFLTNALSVAEGFFETIVSHEIFFKYDYNYVKNNFATGNYSQKQYLNKARI